MAVEPQTKYLERDGTRIAYQVVGSGTAAHVVVVLEAISHLDLIWTDPSLAAAMSDASRRDATAILMQQRGVGLSEPTPRPPTVEEQAGDILAIMDAEGIQAATLSGTISTTLPVALVAAQHPERVTNVILDAPVLSAPKAGPPYAGYTEAQAMACIEAYEGVRDRWGEGGWLPIWDPALATPTNMRLAAMLERCAASSEMAHAVVEQWLSYDGREIFPQVRVPTRVLGHPHYTVFGDGGARAVAQAIPGADYRTVPGSVLGDSMGESWSLVIEHILDLALGSQPESGPAPDRVLASVLFTDVVGSTERVAALGDAAWAQVLRQFDSMLRRQLAVHGGRHVNDTGDGALCELPGPAAAIRCAQALCAAAPELGIEIRAGVHTGECERRGENLAGLAVHIGARVCAAAQPGEVLVSRTVRDLMAGSEVPFASRGPHDLKGVPGEWELLAAGEEEEAPAPLEPAQPTPTDRVIVGLARRAPGAMRTAGRITGAVQKRRLARA